MRRFLSIMIAVLFVLAVSLVQAYEAHIEEVIAAPTATHTKSFGIDATMEIWERALDNPYLMGRLWGVYKFHPPYMVSKTNTGINVSDPSGIVGEIRQIGQSDFTRTFFATGTFDHWAVPSFFTASGVVIFTYNTAGDGLEVESTLFMRGDNGISRFVMKLFSGILARRINNRVGSTLENMQTIIGDITHHSDMIRGKLTGQTFYDFNSVFPEVKTTSEEDHETPSDIQNRMY